MQNDWQGFAQPKPNTDKIAQLGWEHGLPAHFPPGQLPQGMGVLNTPTPQGVQPQHNFPPITVPPIQLPPMAVTEAQALPQPQASVAPPPQPQGNTVWAVVKIGRMDRGEFVFVATEGVFADKDKAFAFASSRGEKNWWEKIMGSDCWCERGVHETVLYSN